MIDKNLNISIRPRSSLQIHTDIIQSKDESDCQQLCDSDEPSAYTLRKLIHLQNTALLMLEKSAKLLRESAVLLQEHIQGTLNESCSSTRQDTANNKDSKCTIQTNPASRMGCTLPNQAEKQTFPMTTRDIENISVGSNSQQTIILEGEGLVRARNIATGNGSRQIIGRLSDATLHKLVGSWNRDL
ncbi:hypothetical protein DER44DRAFT_188876 [Fusarium oxysporum]|nr:hypothetical protein DER44DRAFT_188876 [Fusarium oxysporum]